MPTGVCHEDHQHRRGMQSADQLHLSVFVCALKIRKLVLQCTPVLILLLHILKFEISHTALNEKSQEATLCAAGNPTED